MSKSFLNSKSVLVITIPELFFVPGLKKVMAYLGLHCLGSFENVYYDISTYLCSDQSFKKKD